MMQINLPIFLLIGAIISMTAAWKRSCLIYSRNERTDESWKRHLMRIDASGNFNEQWLFDAAILTTETVNGIDIYYGKAGENSYLSGKDLSDLIDMLYADAIKLENAATSLSSQLGNPPDSFLPIKVFIAFPYLNPENKDLRIDGVSYDLSNPDRRMDATRWYVDRLRSKIVNSKTWRFLNFGIYYHREDVLIHLGDDEYLRKYNSYLHELNMESLWVPYYDTPIYAFNGTVGLGFDSVVIQPRYSFLNSIDGGVLKGDRLYSTGYKAGGQQQCMEYEARSQGESDVEHYVAHQYLAISQFTQCDRYKQVFFLGAPDIFDKVSMQNTAKGKMWATYTDLANYLKGDSIFNMEVGIGEPFRDTSTNSRELQWVVNGNYLENLNAIRMDFNDVDETGPWRGKLAVLVEGDTMRSSFAYRMGTDEINPTYNSIFVPLSNERIISGTRLVIRLDREVGSPWPNIMRLVASKYEPTFIANPIANAITTSTVPVSTQNYQDSRDTQTNYGSGYLTDGTLTNEPWYGGAVGWHHLEKRISVTIDLGGVRSISSVKVYAWRDYGSAIAFPKRMGVMAAQDCEPQERGTLYHCVPTASSSFIINQMQSRVCGTFCDKAVFTADFGGNGNTVMARYVTVSFVAMAWSIMDEVQVLDPMNRVISTGRPYRVTPKPGVYSDDAYKSDGQNLADGAIFRNFIFGRNVVGFINQEGNAELNWVKPATNVSWAIVWMTNADNGSGIILPATIKMQWKNGNGIWQQSSSVSTSTSTTNCPASPCAKLALPSGASVTGVRATIPASGSWTMVSEISLM